MDSNSIAGIAEAITTSEILVELIKGLFIVLVAYIAYRSGLRAYFKKREHEQIMKRYLEEGVDRALACVEHAIGVYLDNHRTAWQVIKQIQAREGFGPSVSFGGVEFRTTDQRYFEISPWVKINNLLGDEIFWKFFQSLFAFVDNKTVWFKANFTSAIERNGVFAEVDVELNKYEQYLPILKELQLIASIFEKEKTLTWADLGEFKNRPEIKKSVGKLKQKLDELESKAFKEEAKDEQKQ